MAEHISALQCSGCSYLTQNLNMLFSHCLYEHSEEKIEVSLYKCPFCEMKCSVKNVLEEHIEQYHPTSNSITIYEVTRFTFHSGHHFIHRPSRDCNSHSSTSSSIQLVPNQNWSTYSANTYPLQATLPTTGKRDSNWKIPEMNATYTDTQLCQQTSQSKSKLVQPKNTWWPANKDLSKTDQEELLQQQAFLSQMEKQPLKQQKHKQPQLTPAPNIQQSYNLSQTVMPPVALPIQSFYGPSVMHGVTTMSETAATLLAPRYNRVSKVPLQHMIYPAISASDLHTNSNVNTVSAAHFEPNHLSIAQYYLSRQANLAQRILMHEEANGSNHNNLSFQDKMSIILKRQEPLILRQSEQVGLSQSQPSNSTVPNSSTDVDKFTNQDTPPRSTQCGPVSPNSASTKSSSQEDVGKSSQTSNGSTSSVSACLAMSQSLEASTETIVESADGAESGKPGDKAARIQCNKCPESFDNAKALFCHRHFHHESIVSKGRKHIQNSLYSQTKSIDSDKRRYLSGCNGLNNVVKTHETLPNTDKVLVTYSESDKDKNRNDVNGELAIDLTLNNDDEGEEVSTDVVVDDSLDVNRNVITRSHLAANLLATAQDSGAADTLETVNGMPQTQLETAGESEVRFVCNSCNLQFPTASSLQEHYRRSRKHKTYGLARSKTRRKTLGNRTFGKSGSLDFGSVTRLRLASSPKTLRLRKKENMKSQTTTPEISSSANDDTSRLCHSCTECSLCLTSLCQLLCHCWQIHKIRPLRCGYCHQYFVVSREYPDSAKSQLANHLLSKHGALQNEQQQLLMQNSVIRPAQCNFCDKVFANKPSAKKHMKEEHQEYSQNKKARFSEETNGHDETVE